MTYSATLKTVPGVGTPKPAFLDEMVNWAQTASDDIFAPNARDDIYSRVRPQLGPYTSQRYRVGVMLEVMRVVAGHESNWDWAHGPFLNPKTHTPEELEAGAWQVSANSMNKSTTGELRNLVQQKVGSTDANAFQAAMKSNHTLAMEYFARLLRWNYAWNGPIINHHIDPHLSVAAAKEFVERVFPVGDYPIDRSRRG